MPPLIIEIATDNSPERKVGAVESIHDGVLTWWWWPDRTGRRTVRTQTDCHRITFLSLWAGGPDGDVG